MAEQGFADLYRWQVERSGDVPLYRQVYLQMRSAILSRDLCPGARLPSTRALATRLGVSRASVVSAYAQLLAEGYLAGKVGSGTYISFDIPEALGEPARRAVTPGGPQQAAPARGRNDEARARTVDRPFNTGRTLVDARTTDILRRLTHHELRSLSRCHLGYSDPCGLEQLRSTICDYLRAARAVNCDPEQIIVTAGTQSAIDLAIRVLLQPGDQVWVEDPGYPFACRALLAAGMRIADVPVDAQGLDVRAGRRSAPQARAALVTPSHQYPLGVVLSMSRRLELLAWARETGGWVIEDDYASEFRYSGHPLSSLQGLDDGDRVVYIGTFNKALFPGLRLGYMVVPYPVLEAFATARDLKDRQPPSLTQAVIAEFLRQGHLTAHIRRMRLFYHEQRDLLAAELSRKAPDALTVDVPDQGLHLIAYLNFSCSDVDLEELALSQGIVARAISRLHRKAPARPGLMLGFSGFTPQMILPAASQLAAIARGRSRLGRAPARGAAQLAP
jgi:GntR family transcriptional regulator/MocR family aminotransferase